MASVDELIDVIDNGDGLTAQKLLEQQPALATGESLREGVQQHCIGRRTRGVPKPLNCPSEMGQMSTETPSV